MNIPEPILKLFDTLLIGPVVRRIKILNNCSDNVEKLRIKVRELQADSNERRDNVDRAEIAGQVETHTGSNWFEGAGEIEAEATAIQEQYHQRGCAGGWCVNCWSLYKLSKRSVQLTQRADGMLNRQCDLIKRPPPKPVIQIESEPIENQPSTQLMLDRMLGCIGDPNIGTIGVYGMGGVGKTTLVEKVNNHFIGKENIENSPFNIVIMVTVSATPDIPSIRTKIGKRLDLDLSNDKEDDAREKLLDVLRKKKFLLILDDVWYKLELKDVGIPRPGNHQGCTILITTRTIDICTQMDADIKMEVPRLSPDESWNLFVEKAGQHVTTDPINRHAETIVRKCAGLPLALVAIARAMADRQELGEWADAIRQMEQPSTNYPGMTEEVYDLLKFSFDRLKDDMLRSLFLYLATFPEDYDIGEDEMLTFCVGEGLVDKLGNLAAAKNHGVFLIGSLKNASMLEDRDGGKGSVRMHDMMRELAHWITSSTSNGSPKFLIKTGLSCRQAPYANEWIDATKVALMHTQIVELPYLRENCPNLTTLLLRNNWTLKICPGTDFFQHMNNLGILDLYNLPGLYDLSNSLSSLKNLRVLRCRWCTHLKALPELGMLRQLQVLDLYGCESLGQKILTPERVGDVASNLRYLDVGVTNVYIPAGAISRLLKLEVLKFIGANHIKWSVRSENEKRDGGASNDPSTSEGKRVEGNNVIDVEELSHLTMLTSLAISFEHISISDWFQPLAKSMNNLELNWCTCTNQDAIEALDESENLQYLQFLGCSGLTCVPTRVSGRLRISECKDLEVVFDRATAYRDSFQRLESLYLKKLPNLERICVGLPLPNCFGQLLIIVISDCDKLRMVFTKGTSRRFTNLQSLEVERCKRMEVIIEAAEEEDGQLEENNNNGVISPFPKLRKLSLDFLPCLTDVCRNLPLRCPSLEDVIVTNCPQLLKDHLSPPNMNVNTRGGRPPNLISRPGGQNVRYKKRKFKRLGSNCLLFASLLASWSLCSIFLCTFTLLHYCIN